jgi:flagellar biosynthesis/type III secretory pathway chaperone
MKAPEEVLACLDELTRVLTENTATMRRLRECVQRNDNAALAALLRSGDPEALTRRVREIRDRIADAVGLPARGLNLGRLAESLGGPAAIALNDRRERLLLMVARFQDEALATGRLVRHALEFSVRLLSVLLDAGQDGTYSADGEVALQCRGATFQHTV